MANLDAKTLPAAQANNSHRLFPGNIPCFSVDAWSGHEGLGNTAIRLFNEDSF